MIYPLAEAEDDTGHVEGAACIMHPIPPAPLDQGKLARNAGTLNSVRFFTIFSVAIEQEWLWRARRYAWSGLVQQASGLKTSRKVPVSALAGRPWATRVLLKHGRIFIEQSLLRTRI